MKTLRRNAAPAVIAFAAVWLPISAASAEPPGRTREVKDPQQEMERLRKVRFEDDLRRAREADRVREAERVRRQQEAQARTSSHKIERTRETEEAARERKRREHDSLMESRLADRERTARRNRMRRDRHLPSPQ